MAASTSDDDSRTTKQLLVSQAIVLFGLGVLGWILRSVPTTVPSERGPTFPIFVAWILVILGAGLVDRWLNRTTGVAADRRRRFRLLSLAFILLTGTFVTSAIVASAPGPIGLIAALCLLYAVVLALVLFVESGLGWFGPIHLAEVHVRPLSISLVALTLAVSVTAFHVVGFEDVAPLGALPVVWTIGHLQLLGVLARTDRPTFRRGAVVALVAVWLVVFLPVDLLGAESVPWPALVAGAVGMGLPVYAVASVAER